MKRMKRDIQVRDEDGIEEEGGLTRGEEKRCIDCWMEMSGEMEEVDEGNGEEGNRDGEAGSRRTQQYL